MKNKNKNIIELIKIAIFLAILIAIIYGFMMLDKAILTSDMPWWLKWLLVRR